MHAYYSEASLGRGRKNEAAVDPYHASARVDSTFHVGINVSNSSRKLDPWTVYELAKETQKIKTDRRKELQMKMNPDLEVGKTEKGNIQKARRVKASEKTKPSATKSQSKNFAVLPTAAAAAAAVTNTTPDRDRDVQKRLAIAKLKRKSLLCEVTVRNLYEGRRQPCHHALSSRTPHAKTTAGPLEKSVSSLPALSDDDDNDFGFLEEGEDVHHNSCYF